VQITFNYIKCGIKLTTKRHNKIWNDEFFIEGGPIRWGRSTPLTDTKKIALQERLAHHYNGVSPVDGEVSLSQSVKYWEGI
jgi:hypothetical protein